MTVDPNLLARRLRRLYPRSTIQSTLALPTLTVRDELSKYKDDPVGFARDILGVELTPDQQNIIKQLPGRVKIESGHSVGKSFLMAVILLWWFYTRNPSVVICNSPKLQQMEDVLWGEVRLLWQRAKKPLPNYFIGPKAAEMYHTPDHWAKAYTTSKGEAYHGRHRENMLFLFDEDEGIEPIYWEATSSMYQPDMGHGWVASCNPLTTASRSFVESGLTEIDGKTPKWKLFTLSCLNHPNILAYQQGLPPPIPNAVSIGQVHGWVKDWTTPINPDDRAGVDFEWPPKSGIWRRPGPTFKSRVMGIRPTEGIDTVWSAALWASACTNRWLPKTCWEQKYGITIGVDSSGYGDDDACFHVRTGPLSLHHEAYNGWSPEKAAGHVKELCCTWAKWYNDQASWDRGFLYKPTDVDVTFEFDGGYGIGVHSHRQEYYKWGGITVGSGSDKYDPNGKKMYKNLRAEIWVESAAKANKGLIDVSGLLPEDKEKLRLQLLSAYFEVLPDGSKIVEPKKEVKERLGRSPDDADSFIICHHDKPVLWPTVVTKGGRN